MTSAPDSLFPVASRKLYISVWFAILTALAGIAAYYDILTGFSIWDDEGMLLLSVKQYVSGMKLYDQVFSIYGPIYYFYNWILRVITHTPVTHDVNRISTLIPWLLAALICAWIVLRFTKSLLLASIAHVSTFCILSFFKGDPGHPEELCILLLVCLVASGTWVKPSVSRTLPMIALGALTAALLLIKVNIGIFVMLSIAVALLSHARRNILTRLLLLAVGAACLALPFVLMEARLDDAVAERYCLVVMGSLLAMFLVLYRVPGIVSVTARDFWIVAISFLCVVGNALIVLAMQGVSFYGVLYSLILLNFRMRVSLGQFYIPVQLGWPAIPAIVGGLACAALITRKGLDAERAQSQVNYLKLGFALTVGCLALTGHSLLACTPFSWLILFPHSELEKSSQGFPRTLLCSTTVLQTLYAYPVGGSQQDFIQILLIVMGIVCLGDFCLSFRSAQLAIPRPFLRATTAVLLLCVPTTYLMILHTRHRAYDALPSLDLPGAHRIHLPEDQARDYRWLVRNLDEHCKSFVGFPGIPSLYFWTGDDPPADMDANSWMLVYSDQQQLAVAAALSDDPNACAIYSPDLVGVWNRDLKNMDVLPLSRYIHTNFKTVGKTGQYYFLVRKERNLAAIFSP